MTSNFIEHFNNIFGLYSLGSIYYGQLCAHVLLGQALKKCKLYFGPIFIDPRISIFLISPSATGKSIAWPFIYGVGRQAGFDVQEVDDTSDAALVGNIEDVEVIDPETHTKIIQHNKVMGVMASGELLHYDEGNFLVDRAQYAKNTITWFQKALNPIDSEQNKCTVRRAHGTIEIFPTCSLVITSYPIDGLLDAVIKTGFFQRIVLYPRDIPIEERKQHEFDRASNISNHIYTEPDIKGLGDELQKIRAKYSGKEIVFNSSTIPVIKIKIKALYDLILPAHPKVKEIMATFIPRFNNFMYIFAFHHCCDRYGSEVEIEDINYAYSLISMLFRELMNWVEENADFYKMGSKDYSYMRLATSIYQKMQPVVPGGFVMKNEFIAKCADVWRVSLPTVLKYIEKFKGYGKLKEIEQDRIHFIKMEN